MSDGNDELEQFRRQWQEEVSQRRRTATFESQAGQSSTQHPPSSLTSTAKSKGPSFDDGTAREIHHDTHVRGTYNFDDLEAREESRRLGPNASEKSPERRKEPQSALEHFELAIEKESQGNMQESLVHYRKAYKLDSRVDLVYRNKHFPPTTFQSKPSGDNPSNAPVTVPNTAHHSLHGGGAGAHSELIQSFARSPIEPTVPDVEGVSPSPCHLAGLPHEIMILVMQQVALMDAASLMRLSYVCKKLAYLAHVEDALWKSVCWDSRHGFSDMHYEFALTVKWQELPRKLDENLDTAMAALDLGDSTAMGPQLLPVPNQRYQSFLDIFHSRPRIRFSGVYISTVNYIRAGASTANSVYWGNSPVHMVTYYRYIRFHRDGSAISLLTTFQPHDVVPLLHKTNIPGKKELAGKDRLHNIIPSSASSSTTTSTGQGQAGSVQPPTVNAVMRDARKARWRLSPLHNYSKKAQEGGSQSSEPEGNLYIESEGPTPQYTYHLQLTLQSVKATGVALNTKLVWRSFWSYNNITDDWAEFNLRNDKQFVFSRVKSWVDV